jgi:hypothetical protein
MKYQSEISKYGDVDADHPEGTFWAYRSHVVGPGDSRKTCNVITMRDMEHFDTASYGCMNVTRYISKSWRVTVANGRVRAIK